MSDNIGGIILASYCFIDDVMSSVVTKKSIAIHLRGNKSWTDFPASLGNIDISVTENEINGSSLFNIDGKIRCPRQKYENMPEMIHFRSRRILVKYVTANGDVLVVGDKENSIKATHKILNPKDASGFSGVEYTLTGVMKHPELPLL